MDVWSWLAVYVVGLVALQLFVFRYFRGSSDANGRGAPDGSGRHGGPLSDRGFDPEPGVPSPPAEAGVVPPDEAGRRCERCGARNEPDPVFSLCWNCTARLS